METEVKKLHEGQKVFTVTPEAEIVCQTIKKIFVIGANTFYNLEEEKSNKIFSKICIRKEIYTTLNQALNQAFKLKQKQLRKIEEEYKDIIEKRKTVLFELLLLQGSIEGKSNKDVIDDFINYQQAEEKKNKIEGAVNQYD